MLVRENILMYSNTSMAIDIANISLESIRGSRICNVYCRSCPLTNIRRATPRYTKLVLFYKNSRRFCRFDEKPVAKTDH